MITKLKSIELTGLEGTAVDVEVHTSTGHGRFTIIGLPDAALSDASYRVGTALKQTPYGFPFNRVVTVNLAPADLTKEGPSYDMALALGIVLAVEDFRIDLSDSVFIGEVSLDGGFRGVRGMLAFIDAAKKLGFKKVYVPFVNAKEASVISGIEIYPVKNIVQLVKIVTGVEAMLPLEFTPLIPDERVYEYDLAMIKGQDHAKRALCIALAGGHNLLLQGPPGSGKTLLAKTSMSLLPHLSHTECVEIAKLQSLVSTEGNLELKDYYRPFRSPHHSSSLASLVGGGRIPRPGEISLAHKGILFLDELPEFTRPALEALRQPLEDGKVTIARVFSSVTFPCRTLVIGAFNPCPCGYYGDPQRSCKCTDFHRNRYLSKLSGPLLDRFDLQVIVPRLSYDELTVSKQAMFSSQDMRKVIERCRSIANQRFAGMNCCVNGEMGNQLIKKFCTLDEESEKILSQAAQKFLLSGRAITRILKISRTIADLESSENIQIGHLLEALSYRFTDRM